MVGCENPPIEAPTLARIVAPGWLALCPAPTNILLETRGRAAHHTYPCPHRDMTLTTSTQTRVLQSYRNNGEGLVAFTWPHGAVPPEVRDSRLLCCYCRTFLQTEPEKPGASTQDAHRISSRSDPNALGQNVVCEIPYLRHAAGLCFLALAQWLETTTAITGRDNNAAAHSGHFGLVKLRTKRYSGTAVLAPLSSSLPVPQPEFWENDWFPSR
jgi:hypothetical protein